MDRVALIDATEYLRFAEENSSEIPDSVRALAQETTRSFHETGILILRDPRVDESANDTFIEMMERYYVQAGEKLYNGENVAEVHPELGFQVGATPELTEKARDHCSRYAQYEEQNQPLSQCPPQLDAKWRYFWRIGQFGEHRSRFEVQNAVPEGFEDWEVKMNRWGQLMLDSVYTVASLLEIGLGLEKGKLTQIMNEAPHLLAPTGSDLQKFNQGTIFAGFHYDLNFITIHGKSRFPGLFAWLRDGTKIKVSIPQGCLLLQAAKMLEHLTGGWIMAGFHEVVFSEDTQAALERAREEGRILWRISSTLFAHLRSDVILRPLPELANLHTPGVEFKEIRVEEFVMEEIKAINLLKE